jgi:hypothetical protein
MLPRFKDFTQLGGIAGRLMLWDEAEPGGEVTALLEARSGERQYNLEHGGLGLQPTAGLPRIADEVAALARVPEGDMHVI